MNEMRQKIVDEAREFIGTRYHHEARKKGVGIDCGMLLLEVYETVGLIPHIEPGHYPVDFMMHRDREWYLEIILKFADEIFTAPLPGDVIMFQHGRLYCHGAIVIDWPKIIHASSLDKYVVYGDADRPPWSEKKKKFFRHKMFIEEKE